MIPRSKRDWLTTTELGALVNVHQSTMCRYVKKGAVKAIPTPGRHLRISKKEAVRFLRKYGYVIPKELTK